MKENNEENIKECICPVCNSTHCKIEEGEDGYESRVCEDCGFMTVSSFKCDSNYIQIYEQTTAKIIKALRFEDKTLNQYWYPTTLFINNKGAIFPVGTEKDWYYGYAPVVPVPIHERLQYPIPGKTDEYYEMRLAVEQTHKCNSFKDAVEKLMG